MNDLDLQRHQPTDLSHTGDGLGLYCRQCREPAPCDAARARDEIAEQRASVATLVEALGRASDIIEQNPGEDICRHQRSVLECDGEDGRFCIDRWRRELIADSLADLSAAAKAHDARLTTAAVEAALSDLRRQVRACQPTRTTLAYRQGHDDARGSVFEMIAALLASHPSAVDKEGIE
jgi:hypothetical protein